MWIRERTEEDLANINQIRGMLLEEAVLYLLRNSGYSTIDDPYNDPTLNNGRAGLEVSGRGTVHQIDAIADFTIAHPFSHPQRLLVEAKFKNSPVGIEVLRNAVGVLKDVNEYWVSPTGNYRPGNGLAHEGRAIRNRYHYQYAVFSPSGYTPAAETYAFAQDVYLIPLASSKFFKPVVRSIAQLNAASFAARRPNRDRFSMTELRQAIRKTLHVGDHYRLENLGLTEEAQQDLIQFSEATKRINQAVLGMILNQIPIFLVSSCRKSSL